MKLFKGLKKRVELALLMPIMLLGGISLYIGARDQDRREKEAAAKVEYLYMDDPGIDPQKKAEETAKVAAEYGISASRVEARAAVQAKPPQSYGRGSTYIETEQGLKRAEASYEVTYDGKTYPTAQKEFVPKAAEKDTPELKEVKTKQQYLKGGYTTSDLAAAQELKESREPTTAEQIAQYLGRKTGYSVGVEKEGAQAGTITFYEGEKKYVYDPYKKKEYTPEGRPKPNYIDVVPASSRYSRGFESKLGTGQMAVQEEEKKIATGNLISMNTSVPWYKKMYGKAYTAVFGEGNYPEETKAYAKDVMQPKNILRSLAGVLALQEVPGNKLGWTQKLETFTQGQEEKAIEDATSLSVRFSEFKDVSSKLFKGRIDKPTSQDDSSITDDKSKNFLSHIRDKSSQVNKLFVSEGEVIASGSRWFGHSAAWGLGEAGTWAVKKPVTATASLYGITKVGALISKGTVWTSTKFIPSLAENPTAQKWIARTTAYSLMGGLIGAGASQQPTLEGKARAVVGGVSTVAAFGMLSKAGQAGNLRILMPLQKRFNPNYSEPVYEGQPIELKPVHTDPIQKNQLIRQFGNKEAVTIHTTENPKFEFGSSNILYLKSDPSMAKGFRQNLDLLHFYRSLPTDKGTPQAYLAYLEGINPVDYPSSQISTRMTLWPPKKQLIIEKGPVRYFPPQKGESAFAYSQRTGQMAGQTMLPTENIYGMSIERQAVTPSQFTGVKGTEYPGSVLRRNKDLGFTYFVEEPQTPAALKKIPGVDFVNKLVNTKAHKLYMTEVKTEIPLPAPEQVQGVKKGTLWNTKPKEVNLVEYNTEYGNVQYKLASQVLLSSGKYTPAVAAVEPVVRKAEIVEVVPSGSKTVSPSLSKSGTLSQYGSISRGVVKISSSPSRSVKIVEVISKSKSSGSSSPSISPSISPSLSKSTSPSPSPSPSISKSVTQYGSISSGSISMSTSPSISKGLQSISRSVSKSSSRSPSPSPSLSPSPSPTPTPSPWKPRITINRGSSQSLSTEGYNVLVKVRGQWAKINTGALPKMSALSMGARRVAETPQASFVIELAGKKVRATKEDLFFLKRLHMFRQKKNAEGKIINIEKNRYRINTGGELEGITFKGLDILRSGGKKKKRRSFL